MWAPGNRTARRIAALLLGAHRRGTIALNGPGEVLCADAMMKTRFTPGTRHVLGRLWREYGGPQMLKDKVQDDDELRAALCA